MTGLQWTQRLFSCVLCVTHLVPAVAEMTAIRAGRLFDPNTGLLSRNQVLLIEGGKIKAVGPDLAIPTDAQFIDLSEETVLPGLIDAHTHLCGTVDPKWDLGDFWIMARQRRSGFRAIQGAQHAREMLEAGFTTVRDLGNAGDYLDLDLEKAIRFGIIPGPTILPAGRIIAPYGGQFRSTPARAEDLNDSEYVFADTRDELLKAIRKNIYWGAAVIKVVVDAKKYIYSADDLRFIVEQARKAGLRVAAHAQTQRGARNAIDAGVASVEHAWVLSDEDLVAAKANDVVLVTTDFTVESLLALGWSEADARRIHGKRVARLQRAYRAGVPIVFGTDVMANEPGRSRGAMAIEYIESFLEAKIPPLEILRSMTTRAAALLGVERQRGALRPGMAADIVAVPGNVLDDVRLLKRVDFVMKDGSVFRYDQPACP